MFFDPKTGRLTPAGLPDVIDADVVRSVARVLRAMGDYYFRHETRGFHNVPEGPTLVVGNHSGGKIPIDAFLFASSWYEHFQFERPLFALGHDLLFRTSRWLRDSLGRIGCVRATQDNALGILGDGHPLMVLPGGEYETFRPYRDRNRIDFDNHVGFIRTALVAGVPITPVVAIGGHEIFLIVTRGERFARLLLPTFFRARSFPVTLGLPFGLYLGPLPSPLPLPSRIITEIIHPIHLDREEADHPAYVAADATSRRKLAEIYRVVTWRMQSALDRLAAQRRYPVIG